MVDGTGAADPAPDPRWDTGWHARLTALRYRDFRLLWSGSLVSQMGTQMSFIAINWHVLSLLKGTTWTLSGPWAVEVDASALGLGLLGLTRFIPIVTFALFGGLLADAFSRRKVMIVAQSLNVTAAGTLTYLTARGAITVPVIYLLAAAIAAGSALDNPSRQSMVPNLVRREHLSNALSLNILVFHMGTIVGPAVAGILIAQTTFAVVYGLDTLSYLAVIVALLAMHYRGRGGAARRPSLDSLTEGLRFTFRTRIVWSTMLLDFWATFFGSVRTLLPLFASQVLGLGAAGYGLLATAQPVGALAAGSFLALGSEIRRQGRWLLASVALYGVATVFFGSAGTFLLAYLMYALTGVGDTISTVIRGTIRQVNTPDILRGRMTSVNMIFFMGGPQLGDLEAGIVAAVLGVPFAIVSGGLATLGLVVVVARRFPELAGYTSEAP